jgi:hypothetical protein
MATFYGDDWPNLIDGTSRRDAIFGFGSDDDLYGFGGSLACLWRQRPPFRPPRLTVDGRMSEQIELGWSGRQTL